MSIEDGQQILPTEGFNDFAADTKEEEADLENQGGLEQELNDNNTAQLEADDPNDNGEVETDDDNTGTDEDEANAEANDEASSEGSEEAGEADAEGSEKGEGEGEGEGEDEKGEEDEAEAQAKADAEAKELADKEARDKDELTKKEKFDRYSRSVQRRINRGTKQREVLKAENDELRSRLDSIENKMQEDTQSQEASILATRIRNATAIKQQLLEDAEYEQVAQVDNDIMNMTIRKTQLEERANKKPDVKDEGQRPAQAQQDDQDLEPVPAEQSKWIESNERFGKDAKFTKYVNATYDEMIEEGYDPEDAGMYEELNRRTGVTKAAQEDTDTNTNTDTDTDAEESEIVKPKPKPKPRPQSAPTPNVAQAQKPAVTNRGITEADKINMRNWGLDPSKKEVRQEWLANKRGKK